MSNLLRALAFASAVPAQAAEARALSLDECVKIAQEQGISAKIAALETRAAAYRMGQAVVGWLPEASVSGSRDRSYVITKPKPIALGDSRSAGVQASWNLFGGGDVFHTAAASYGHIRAVADERVTRRRLSLDVISAYLQALQNEALLHARDRDVERRAANRERAAALVARGKRARVEELQAAAAYDASRSARAESEFQYYSSLAQLRSLLGFPTGDTIALTAPPEVPIPTVAPEMLAAEFERAWAARPERESAEASVSESRASYGRAVESTLPRVDVTGGYSGVWGQSPWWAKREGASLGLTASFSITGLFRSSLQAMESKTRVAQSEARLDESRRQVALEVERAIYSLRAASAQRSAAESARTSAKEAADIIAERYRLGQAQIVELKDSESQLSSAESDAVSAKGRAQLAVQQFAHAVGEILPVGIAPSAVVPQ